VTDVSLKLLVLKTRDVSTVVAFYRLLGFTFSEEQHGKGPLHHSAPLGDGIIEIYPLPDDQTVDSLPMIRVMILLPLIPAIVGCGGGHSSVKADAADARHEHTANSIADESATETRSAEPTASTATELEGLPAASKKVVWEWLDANIGSQERLAASRAGQRLSGANVGEEIQLSSAQNLLFTEQLNLLYEIRKSKNVAIARQYMLVHTLMTIDQAEHTQSVLPANDPRHAGVRQQITTTRQLLIAIGYDEQLAREKTADRTSE
jgi:hypothetical protein